MRKIILTYLLLIGLSLSAQTLSENAFISLLTCTPGEELYARYGHTALRVCDEEQDLDVVFSTLPTISSGFETLDRANRYGPALCAPARFLPLFRGGGMRERIPSLLFPAADPYP